MKCFLKIWGIKNDNIYYLIEFNNLKRDNGEIMLEFMSRLCKLYHHIPKIVKPSDLAAILAYFIAFEAEFTLHLK
jgi:hypothetical protein